jgi:hypothetical protein
MLTKALFFFLTFSDWKLSKSFIKKIKITSFFGEILPLKKA